ARLAFIERTLCGLAGPIEFSLELVPNSHVRPPGLPDLTSFGLLKLRPKTRPRPKTKGQRKQKSRRSGTLWSLACDFGLRLARRYDADLVPLLVLVLELHNAVDEREDR